MRGRSQKIQELLCFAYELLKAFRPMTLRQLHYAVFSAAKIPYENELRDYRRLSRTTTESRRRHRHAEPNGFGHVAIVAGEIPYEWMVDEIREAEMVSVWDDAAAYVETVRTAYRRDVWQDQPAHCEVWSEKATVLATLRPVTQKLGVMLRVCRGFGSAGMEGVIGKLFEGIEKPIHIFYLGDYDPSGEDIERDIHKRAQTASGKDFTISRLAIHREDIRRFRLPPQKIKDSDPRSAGFRKRHGKDASTVELDALPVEELRARVRSAIEGLIDADRWNQQIKVQEAELKCIADLAAQMKKLPPVQSTQV
jgi:hypothetical protein